MNAVRQLDTSHPVPPEAMGAHLGVFGKTGSGKSYLARGLAERLLREDKRVIVIDPTGVWWGLRSSADGHVAGFPVAVFGGDHADIPVSDGAGERLGTLLSERMLSAIVDVSEFSNAGRARFVGDLLGELYRKNKRPLHLIVDEADTFAPQRPMPNETSVLHHMSQVVRRGRVKGFRVVMITQRPATIHKDVITQINALVALRVTAPQDRGAIEDWIKGQGDTEKGKEVLATLGTLQQGEGWIWAPEVDVLKRAKFPRITTFDSMRAPSEGEDAEPETWADVDVEALREAFAVEPEEPERPARVDTAAIRKAAREEGYRAGYAEGLSDGLTRAVEAVKQVKGVEGMPEPRVAVAAPAAPPAPRQPRPAVVPSSDPLLDTARAVWPARLTWGALAASCGRKARGGHFNAARKRLIDSGVVREESGLVTLTNPPATGNRIAADLLEENLPQPAAKLFAHIRRNPGATVDALSSALGMAPRGGHWNFGMSVLRTNGLIEDHGGKMSVAEHLL